MYLLILLASCITTTFSAIVTYKVIAPEGNFSITNDNYMTITSEQIYQNRSIKIILDGWQPVYSWYPKITGEYMLKEKTIVIQAYTESFANPNYFEVVKNTTIVGETIGKLIVSLKDSYSISLNDVHPIGHSLGGQVVGVICEYVKTQTGTLIFRATALDPPQIGFYTNQHLHKDVAVNVDVIYTSLISSGPPIGKINFYPNGGHHQTACLSANNPLACDHHIFTCMRDTVSLGRDPVNTGESSGKYFFTTVSFVKEYQEMFKDSPIIPNIPIS